ncbi:MAG: plasmid mobilization relaxosome protein MobC [Oscillospiraceae bacterium]
MRKGIKKQFWLSEKDAADLKQKAQRCGITETAMIRMLLHSYEPREKPDERFYEAMREMYAIGIAISLTTISASLQSMIWWTATREKTSWLRFGTVDKACL